MSLPPNAYPDLNMNELAVHPVTVTQGNFDSLVADSTVPVLLDFWSASCVPCMLMKRAVDRAADLLGDGGRVGLVNVEQEPELVDRFGVRGTPRFLVLVRGEVVHSFGGLTTAGALAQRVRDHAPAAVLG